MWFDVFWTTWMTPLWLYRIYPLKKNIKKKLGLCKKLNLPISACHFLFASLYDVKSGQIRCRWEKTCTLCKLKLNRWLSKKRHILGTNIFHCMPIILIEQTIFSIKICYFYRKYSNWHCPSKPWSGFSGMPLCSESLFWLV